jgi:dephospho-CoA kinase
MIRGTPRHDERSDVLVVLGRACAGKTTFGEYAAQTLGVRFIEASLIMRALGTEFARERSSPEELAWKVIRAKGSEAIATEAIRIAGGARSAVIAGFRLVQELEAVRRHIPGARVLWLEASQQLRFERTRRRGRVGDPTTIEEFGRRDSDQELFGLLAVAPALVDLRMVNDGTLDAFRRAIEAVVHGRRPELPFAAGPADLAGDQLELAQVVRLIEGARRSTACTEVGIGVPQVASADRDGSSGLRRLWRPFIELSEPAAGQRSYTLTAAGQSYLRLLTSIRARP